MKRWGGSWHDDDLLEDLAEAGVTREMVAEAYRRQTTRQLAEAAGLTPGQVRMAALVWGVLPETSSERLRASESDERA